MADIGATAATSGTPASEMTAVTRAERAWRPLEPRRARFLGDARLQLHHAAQLVAGLGVSYLARRDDDSHTSMEWLPTFNALASNPVGEHEFRLAIRPRNLNLIAITADVEADCFTLDTRTMPEAVEWIRRTTAQHGLDPSAYTTEKHYAVPPHAVGDGRPFDAADRDNFEQLDHWYSNAALLLDRIAAQRPNASPVRCWPHHFDVATLIATGASSTLGVGLEPGDEYYAEPYWYVSVNRAAGSASSNATRSLPEGNGLWHSRDWFGAVLPASHMEAVDQLDECITFMESAIISLMPMTSD